MQGEATSARTGTTSNSAPASDCGRVWASPPGGAPLSPCGGERSICLTCDRAWPEDVIRRCPFPGEDLRRRVRACSGRLGVAAAGAASGRGETCGEGGRWLSAGLQIGENGV